VTHLLVNYIDIVWEPYWTPEKIDPKVRAMMGF